MTVGRKLSASLPDREPMFIDAFTHALTEEFFETLAAEVGFAGLSGRPSFLWNMDRRLEHMHEYGIDKHVVTIAPLPFWRDLRGEHARRFTRLANDEIRSLADAYPDRLIPVGTIPRASGEMLAEFDRCIEDLDMAGVQIFSNIDGEPLDRPRFAPLFERAEIHGVPLWLHPQLYEWYDWTAEYMDHRLFGWPFDTTLALSRLVFGGVTQAYDFDLIAHHGGGMIPFYRGRIDGFYETRLAYPENYADTDLPDLEQPVSGHFAEFYADTAIGGTTPAYASAHDLFGDHLVFATDYPFGAGRGSADVERELAAVETLDVDDQDRAGIYGGNLQRLLG